MLSQLVMTVKGSVILAVAVYAFASLLRPEDSRWVKGAPFKIVLGLYLLGMWGHTVWVPFLAALVAIPFFARDRADAAALYVITFLAMPVMNTKVVVGSHYLFAVTKYTFCAIGLLTAFCIKKGEGVRLHSRFDIPIVIVLLLEIAQARTPDPTEMMREVLPVLFNIAVPYYVLSRSLNTAEDARRFVLAIALGGFVLAIVATAESRTHWLIYKQVESFLHVSSGANLYQQVRSGMLRAPGSFPESTSLGAFLAAATIAVVAIRSSFASQRKWYLALAILLVGLIAPNSRNALLGVALGFVLFDFYRRKWGPLLAKIGAAGGLYLCLLTAAQFSSYAANLTGKGADTQSSNEYRLLLFKRGMEEVHKHPLLGTTMKKALDNLQDIQQGQHLVDLVNGYVAYGLTSGYLGMVGLLMVFVSLAGAMIVARGRLAANPLVSDLAGFVFAVTGFMILIAAFTSFGGEGSTYFYLTAVAGSSIWALRRTAAVQPAKEGLQKLAASPGSSIRALIRADREVARGRRKSEASEPAA